MDKNEQIKYINAYNRLCQNASIASFYDGKTLDSICERELDMFRKLIKESFELVEKYENCKKKLTWQEIKVEDLKAGIWIYDKKPDCEIFTFFKITKVLSKEDCRYLYGDENKKVFFDNMTDIAREYETGRYFLVIPK